MEDINPQDKAELETFDRAYRFGSSIVPFIKRHKVKLLAGATILLFLANRGLRDDVSELKIENKRLKSENKQTKDVNEVLQTSNRALNNENLSLMDSVFGPRYPYSR